MGEERVPCMVEEKKWEEVPVCVCGVVEAGGREGEGGFLCVFIHAAVRGQQPGLKGLTVSCLRFSSTGNQHKQAMLLSRGVGE